MKNISMRKKLVIVLFLGFIFALSFFTQAQAVELELRFTPPCPSIPSSILPGECPSEGDSSIAGYILRLYRFSLGIAGILAVGAIVVAGVYYIVSGGNPQMQGEAKEWIVSAIWGLALLFGSWILLNTVNPQLVKLREPVLGQIERIDEYVGNFESGTSVLNTIPDHLLSDTAERNNTPTGRIVQADIPQITRDYCEKYAPNRSDCLLSKVNSADSIVCKNCEYFTPFTTGLSATIKANQCRWNPSDTSKCYLNRALAAKLRTLATTIKFQPERADRSIQFKWRVNEMFPPTAVHAAQQHYNGCAFDVGIYASDVVGGDVCAAVSKFISVAGSLGLSTTNEFAGCPGSQVYDTTVGPHIHVTLANCR